MLVPETLVDTTLPFGSCRNWYFAATCSQHLLSIGLLVFVACDDMQILTTDEATAENRKQHNFSSSMQLFNSCLYAGRGLCP